MPAASSFTRVLPMLFSTLSRAANIRASAPKSSSIPTLEADQTCCYWPQLENSLDFSLLSELMKKRVNTYSRRKLLWMLKYVRTSGASSAAPSKRSAIFCVVDESPRLKPNHTSILSSLKSKHNCCFGQMTAAYNMEFRSSVNEAPDYAHACHCRYLMRLDWNVVTGSNKSRSGHYIFLQLVRILSRCWTKRADVGQLTCS